MDIPPIIVGARVDDALVSQTPQKSQYIAELWMLTTTPYAFFQKRYPSIILKPISMFPSPPKFMTVLKNFLKLQKSLHLFDSLPISSSFTFTQTGLAQCRLQLFKNYVPLTRKDCIHHTDRELCFFNKIYNMEHSVLTGRSRTQNRSHHQELIHSRTKVHPQRSSICAFAIHEQTTCTVLKLL